MITLTLDSQTLVLSADAAWVDEFTWSPVMRQLDYSLTGALIVQAGVMLAGRPITLVCADDDAWMPYSTIQMLLDWVAEPDAVFSLNLRGRLFHVMFAAERPLEARPVWRVSNPPADHPYIATIRLIEVPAP